MSTQPKQLRGLRLLFGLLFWKRRLFAPKGPQFSYSGWMADVREPGYSRFPQWCEICDKRVDQERSVHVRDVDNTRFFLVHNHYFCMEHDPRERLKRERPNG